MKDRAPQKSYVYEHWRPDLDRPFWVGKGTGSRRFVTKRGRNPLYNHIIAKLASVGLAVEIRVIAENLADHEAFALEAERITFWRSKGIKLANLAVGGRGGMSGVKRSEESKAKQSATATGRKLSPEHLAKMRIIAADPARAAFLKALHTGRKRPEGTGERISVAVKKSWTNPEARARHADGQRRGPHSEETRAKMRAASTPAKRAKIGAAVKKQWQDPAFRKLVSETMKRTNARRAVANA